MRPATGWMPKRTLTLFSRSSLVISAMAYWALATAMPTGGLMLAQRITTFYSSAVDQRTVTGSDDDALGVGEHFHRLVNVALLHRACIRTKEGELPGRGVQRGHRHWAYQRAVSAERC